MCHALTGLCLFGDSMSQGFASAGALRAWAGMFMPFRQKMLKCSHPLGRASKGTSLSRQVILFQQIVTEICLGGMLSREAGEHVFPVLKKQKYMPTRLRRREGMPPGINSVMK